MVYSSQQTLNEEISTNPYLGIIPRAGIGAVLPIVEPCLIVPHVEASQARQKKMYSAIGQYGVLQPTNFE